MKKRGLWDRLRDDQLKSCFYYENLINKPSKGSVSCVLLARRRKKIRLSVQGGVGPPGDEGRAVVDLMTNRGSASDKPMKQRVDGCQN